MLKVTLHLAIHRHDMGAAKIIAGEIAKSVERMCNIEQSIFNKHEIENE